jgi:tRNA(Ile)-lysidine synthase TilS/MesJ
LKNQDELEGHEDGDIGLAEQEFKNYCEANGFEHDECAMNNDERDDFLKIKKRFMKAIEEKRLVVDGVKLVYTISGFSESAGQKLTVSRPIGKDFLAMDGFKDTQQIQKFNAFIASIAKTEKSFIARLDIVDRQFLQDIATLFLTS